jgi:hypothetical protein
MSLVSESHAMPSTIRAAYRLAARLGKGDAGLDQATALSLLTPPAIQTEKGGQIRARNAINEAVKLGLIRRDEDGVLHLALEWPDPLGDPDNADDQFADVVARLAAAGGKEGENADLLRTAVWTMTRDPREPVGPTADAMRALVDDGIQSDLGTTEARWGQFEHWAVALGWCVRAPMLMADPTAFLRRNIDLIFGDAVELPIDLVLQEAANLCPAFDSGWACDWVLDRLPEERRPRDRHLLPATSHAWLRLYDEGTVRLERRADSGQTRYLSDGDEVVPVAAVKRAT